MIRVEGVTKRFEGIAVLRDLSFQLYPGEIVGFVGPNGAGKTTTMRILAGFLDVDEGKVEIAGHDIFSERGPACASIGYMSERAPLYEEMRVRDYLRFRARIKGVPRGEVNTCVYAVMTTLEVSHLQRRLISRLSKGERQRVALADALVADPPILLLDEPMSGLDPLQRRAFRDTLMALSKERSVLFSSHVLSEVEAVVTRLLVLNRGKLVADGDLESLRVSAQLGADASAEEIFTTVVTG